MAELGDHDPTGSPGAPDDTGADVTGSGVAAAAAAAAASAHLHHNNAGTEGTLGNPAEVSRGIKRQRPSAAAAADDDDDDDDKPGRERRKIEIKFISDKSRRHITFSKRKAGIMKKAYELSVLTGTQVLLLVVSETGLVYTFTTPKLQPLVTKPEGKNLIQACLNAPEPPNTENGVEGETAVDSPEDSGPSQVPQTHTIGRSSAASGGGAGGGAGAVPTNYMTAEQQQQAIAYQNYMAQQQQQQQQVPRGNYSMSQAGMTHNPQV